MRYQESQTVVGVPLAEIEAWLRDVEKWPQFLIGVTRIERLGHERYRFTLADGGDRRTVTVCVRHLPLRHRFTWRALEGPSFTGCLDLEPADDRHTTVKLSISSHPGTLRAGFAEMLLPRMNRAAHDLRNLEERVLVAGS